MFLIRFGIVENIQAAEVVVGLVELQLQEGQRIYEWQNSIEIIGMHPVVGTGIGYYLAFGDFSNAHNFVFNTLAESGLILGVIYLVFFNVLPLVAYAKNSLFVVLFGFYIFFANLSGVAIIQTHSLITYIHLILLILLVRNTFYENTFRRFMV